MSDSWICHTAAIDSCFRHFHLDNGTKAQRELNCALEILLLYILIHLLSSFAEEEKTHKRKFLEIFTRQPAK